MAALFVVSSILFGTLCSSVMSLSPSSRVKDGIESPSLVRACAFGVLSADPPLVSLCVNSGRSLNGDLCLSVAGSPASPDLLGSFALLFVVSCPSRCLTRKSRL